MPDLVLLTVAAARNAWTSAGFIGTFSPAAGHTIKTVDTQSESFGACLPVTTSMVVTYS